MKNLKMKLSIRLKLLIPSILVVAIVCVLLVSLLNDRARRAMAQIGTTAAEAAGKGVISSLQPVMVTRIEGEGTHGTNTNAVRKLLIEKAAEYEINNLYILGTDGSKAYYLVDMEETKVGTGYSVNYSVLKPAFEEGKSVLMDQIMRSQSGSIVTAYLPIKLGEQTVGVLGVDYSADMIKASVKENSNLGVIIGLICATVGSLIIFIIVNSVVRNLKKVDSKVYELASNEGDLTQSIDVRSGDETEEIAGNLNTLLAYIKNIMLDISGNADTLGEASNGMVSQLQDAQLSVDEVSSTMSMMSESMEEISATTSSVNDAVGSMGEMIREVYEGANAGLNTTLAVSKNAQNIMQDAQNAQRDVKYKASMMEARLKEKIEKSGEVKRIAGLVEKILEITDQTSLLSLNASIEAARAGENGKGFAVVAEEIGKLAEESSAAASQIQEVNGIVLDGVNDLASEAEEMLNFLNSVTIKGYGDLVSTGEAYNKDMLKLSEMMENFAARAERIQESADAIIESIESVNVAVEESAGGIENVSKMASELAGDMTGIGDIARKNEEIAGQLNQQVNKFKLQ